MLYELLQFLPPEILHIIWSFIPETQKIFINKQHYHQLNYLIDTIIPFRRYDSYIRDIIRSDSIFVFNYLLMRKFTFWLQKNNYKYNGVIYQNYITFALNYAYNNNASKCNNLINLQLNLSGLKKEWCKNSRIKHNRWSN
tara:strand:- start:2362 stop:2781 length:420 start_codon:yes stop_codon:yes gene_type:complete